MYITENNQTEGEVKLCDFTEATLVPCDSYNFEFTLKGIDFLIPIFLQPCVVDHRYFKL